MPGVHAVFVGAALFGDDAQYAAELQSRAAALEITDRVHFLGFRDDVPALMSAVDIVVHSSTTPEPFGRVIVEAMLAERPVIATRAGGAMEIVEDGRTGMLVAPGEPAALARAITGLLNNPARAATIARNGRRCAESRFTLDSAIPAVERNIVEAARGTKASAAQLTRTSSDRYASHAAPSRETPRL
jgi:glycosyltransferase involved in cell wall biosynthesis